MSLARKARRHWLLLVAGMALAVAAYVAFSGGAEAYHGGFYWRSGYNYDGTWSSCLYSGTTHRILFCF